MKPGYHRFVFHGVKALWIYDYNEALRNIIYNFKGCYDIELSSVFLEKYRKWLRIRFHDFLIVGIPSFKDDDDKRGFNHVKEISSHIGLPILDILMKTEKHKQAALGRKGRQEISKFLTLKERPDLRGKKILMVDDVLTTGSTMKRAIHLIRCLHPREIQCLFVSRRKKEKPSGASNK